MTQSDLEQLAHSVYEEISEIMPAAQEWTKVANLNSIMNMVAGDPTIVDASEFVTERLRELDASIGESRGLRQDLCDAAFARLYDLCVEQGWGALTVEIKAGVPVMVREYRRDIKLTV